MRSEDLERIEHELGLRLPESYRAAMLELPPGRYDGYSFHEEPALIVKRTHEQRAAHAGRQSWPHHYVYIGDEDDACPYALDCVTGSVIRTDHGNLAQPLERFGSVAELLKSLERGLQEVPVNVTWQQSLPVWWSWFWRACLYGVIAGAVLGFVGGFIATYTDPSQAGTYGRIGGYVASVPATLLAFKHALSKHLASLAEIAARATRT